MKSILLFIAISLTAQLPAHAEDDWIDGAESTRAEMLRWLVLEWCENHSGRYTHQQGVPYCLLEGVVFMGEWRAVTTEYWWHRRKDEREDRRVAILWLVAPEHPGRLELECALAAMAVHNPAKVPVVLLGPAAARCPEIPRKGNRRGETGPVGSNGWPGGRSPAQIAREPGVSRGTVSKARADMTQGA